MIEQKHSLPLNVLFISRHHPPIQTGGSRRSENLVAGLRSLGAKVTIISPEIHENDPAQVTIFHPQAEPAAEVNRKVLSKKTIFRDIIRRHTFLPDPDIRWAHRVLKHLKTLDLSAFDVVFTSSPPESIHKVGYKLAKQHKLKWVADFRDLWLEDPLVEARKNPIRKWVETQLAIRWLKCADATICVNSVIASEIEQLSQKPARVVEPHAVLKAAPKALDPSIFHVGHTGSFNLSDPNRKIEDLLEFLSRLVDLCPQSHLHVAGRLLPEEIETVKASPLSNKITVYGLLSPTETQSLQLSMSALILVLSPQSRAIPGKYYEYMACNKPIYGIGGQPEIQQKLNLVPTLKDLLDSNAMRPDTDLEAGVKKMRESLQKTLNELF
ncbi:glycosyltransferase [Litorimonas haliclonae]|uniref:glycosyltransferase n=1 Tax=Litorimonas haliclonae TaxID=2081977 RepID=UPI0039EEA823